MSLATRSDDTSFEMRDVGFNAFAIECLGFGIYTGIFWFTMHMLVFHRSARQFPRRISTFLSIIPLYILAVIHIFVTWFITRRGFVVNGESIETVQFALVVQPTWCKALSISTLSLMLLIADSVTAWRCWIVWSRNWKAVLIPCTLIVVGLGFAIASAFFQLNPSTGIATPRFNEFEKYNLVFFPVTLASTPTSTALIVYRIISIARENGPRLQSTYKTVVEILVESAALYSVVLLVFVVFLGRDDFSNSYVEAMVVSVAGIAPTIISARVALGKARDYTTVAMTRDIMFTSHDHDATTTTLSVEDSSARRMQDKFVNESNSDFPAKDSGKE